MNSTQPVTTRFAPSPTGQLHVGNLRQVIHNWLFARAHGGRFLLRIDDTDAARSEERFVDAIRADLDWLGVTPDGEYRQSERFARRSTSAMPNAPTKKLREFARTGASVSIMMRRLSGPTSSGASSILTPNSCPIR